MRSGILKKWRSNAACWVSVLALCAFGIGVTGYGALAKDKDDKGNKGSGPVDAAASLKTESPIKHVIILIGENRGLDHTFGVYKPKGKSQTISNLLSKGIVNEDGSPGPNFAQAQQFSVAPQSSWYFGIRTRRPEEALQHHHQPDAAAQHQRGADLRTAHRVRRSRMRRSRAWAKSPRAAARRTSRPPTRSSW